MAKDNQRTTLHNIFSLFARSFHILFVLFLVFSYLLAMPLGAYFFYLTEEGTQYSQLVIGGIPLVVPFGGNPWWEPLWFWVGFPLAIGWLFAGLWLVICACLLFAWHGPSEGLKSGISKLKAFSLPLGNCLLTFPILSCLALSLAFLLNTILPSMGAPVGEGPPPMPPHIELLEFTIASVIEEIGFRLIPLGLVSLLLLAAQKPSRNLLRSIPRRQAIWVLSLSLLAPAMAKSKLEQRAHFEGNVLESHQRPASPLGKAEFLSVLVFSIVFGLAHYYVEWWGAGKAISAFAVSVIFGCAYYVYGIAASILLHWFFNCYFGIYYYVSSYFPPLAQVYFADMVFFLHLYAGFALWAILLVKTPQIIAPVRTRLLTDKIRGIASTITRGTFKRKEKPEVRTCLRCGAELPADAIFCGVCGKRARWQHVPR